MNIRQTIPATNIPLIGHYKFTLADIETEEQQRVSDAISVMQEYGLDARNLIDLFHSMCRIQVFEYKNVVTKACWSMIANNFVDATPDNTMLLNKAVLGSSTTTPAITDTQLGTETYRNNLASKSQDATNTYICYATSFFNATETSGTYREAGIVVDGTASANTGVLVSRVAINITKSLSQTLTQDWTLNIGV